VLAHRGLAIDAPENTLLAFLHAASIGVTHLETDVHGSADGVAMISHDPDLRRLTGRDVLVGDLTAAELRAIDLGHGQTFCSLAEALDAFPDAKFNVDVKDKRAVAGTITAITEARAIPRVLIGSFGTARRRATVRGLPGVATSISMIPALFAVIVAKIGLVSLLRWIVRRVDAVQLPARKFGFSITTPRTIRRFQAAGVEVHAWTINDPEEMRALFDAGIDGVVTDRSDLAMELLRPVD
jgi:glycerophosphoryl diester phosphodiesterase